jgi:hypothetical protein
MLRSQYGGAWYGAEVDGRTMEGWLCPALLKYFPLAPAELYVDFTPIVNVR